jgi:hypothetical protein
VDADLATPQLQSVAHGTRTVARTMAHLIAAPEREMSPPQRLTAVKEIAAQR